MSKDQVLMAALSPSFYTRKSDGLSESRSRSQLIWCPQDYGKDSWNKNYLLKSDDFPLARRWELLMANRDSVDLIEAVTW